jgi:hypothetical protein
MTDAARPSSPTGRIGGDGRILSERRHRDLGQQSGVRAQTVRGQLVRGDLGPDPVFDHRDPHRLATAIAEAIRATAAASRLAEERMGLVEINLY